MKLSLITYWNSLPPSSSESLPLLYPLPLISFLQLRISWGYCLYNSFPVRIRSMIVKIPFLRSWLNPGSVMGTQWSFNKSLLDEWMIQQFLPALFPCFGIFLPFRGSKTALDIWYRWTYLQSRNRDTEVGNKLCRYQGGWCGVGWIGRLELTYMHYWLLCIIIHYWCSA